MGRLRVVTVFIAIIILTSGSFTAGAVMDRSGMLPGSIISEPQSVASTFTVYWQAWDLVQQNYVDRSALDQTKMTYGSIDGMLNSLGDVGHTRFLTPKQLQEEMESLSGQLQGIGAEVGVRDGAPVVVAPIPGSPAQKAGIKPGDIIVRVNGEDVTGLSISDIVSKIRGPAGTQVTLTIIHRGQTELVDVTITRAKITVHNVSWTMLPGTKVAHVLISQFGERTTNELASALKEAQSNGATAVILDLRNDPGGIRDEAVGVGSQFLKDGNVLIEQDAKGQRTNYPVKAGGVAVDMPMNILINEGTASAAEIVAGALQDYHRGQLIGATTFGTGTVLTPYDLRDGSAILLGTEEWLTPDGNQIWHHGIKPEISVTLPANGFPLIPNEESGLTPEQLQSSQDTQLLRALQEITNSSPGQ